MVEVDEWIVVGMVVWRAVLRRFTAISRTRGDQWRYLPTDSHAGVHSCHHSDSWRD